MISRRQLGWLAVLWLLNVCTAQEDATCDSENGVCKADPSESCGLYLAPSTIPNAGLGVFTTRPLKRKSVVQPAGEVNIPIVDQHWHMGNKEFFWPLKDYYWIGSVMGMAQESVDDDVEAYCPGYDSTLNCNLALINVGKTIPQWDTAGLHRWKDPGAGAITYYHNGTHPVTADIPAGGELFKFYGDDWFTGREDKFGLIPLREDYTEAEILVKKLVDIGLPSEVRDNFWEMVISTFPWESRTINALPSAKDLDLVAEEGIKAVHYPKASRDVHFLEANGRCLDNMLPGPSTIKQAGRGAFADRFLPEGTIITGSPLSVVIDRSYLYMYGSKFTSKGKEVRNTDDLIGHQLMLNYCMGHPESNLLLCPYGTFVNYINHNQTQANVKIQWTENGIIAQNDTYFDLEVHEMEGKYKTSLAIDYVALRDIEKGEELFLDYGDEFEEAWNRHVENWTPPKDSEHYLDADSYNRALKEDAVLRTAEEQKVAPYPSNLELHCHAGLKSERWPKQFGRKGQAFKWTINKKGHPCEILSRRLHKDGYFVYRVRMEYQDDSDDGENESTTTLYREDVPRTAILFVDTPYSTDMHLKGAFRHEIGIPDDIFPERWRNREREPVDTSE